MTTVSEQFAANVFARYGLTEDLYRRLREGCGLRGNAEPTGWVTAQRAQQDASWVAVYPYPTRHNHPDIPAERLERMQAQWDAAERRFLERLEAVRESDARHAAEDAAREAKQAAARQAIEQRDLDALTARLRRSYLSVPGSTEEAFQTALPDLLEEERRRAVREGVRRGSSPISLAEMMQG